MYADAQGWTVAAVSAETVTGAGRRARPQFESLRGEVRAHPIDTVAVVKLDRLGRSVPDVLACFSECEAAGVRVVVTTESIDTATPDGRFTRTILAAVADFEGEQIRERTRAAMTSIRSGSKRTRSGQASGQPRVVSPKLVERACDLRGKGHPWAEIAQLVGLRTKTVRRAVWESRTAPVAVENSHPGESVEPPRGAP
jgi:putative DNA-invertase from lambdoid prophage Rac